MTGASFGCSVLQWAAWRWANASGTAATVARPLVATCAGLTGERRRNDSRYMRSVSMCAIVMLVASGSGSKTRFSVDGMTSTPSTTVATIQPRTGSPGYSWLRIYFYPSALGSDDNAAATKGRVGSIKEKWSAVLQLTVDSASKVWQVDLALPGHTCTVAESDLEAKNALPEFRFDGDRLRLRGKGSHVCDMKSLGIPNQTLGWDVDLDIPVVKNAR